MASLHSYMKSLLLAAFLKTTLASRSVRLCPDGYVCGKAKCTISNTVGDGPDCRCADGFAGKITWAGETPHGSCEPVPCHVQNSNGKSGIQCACSDGYAGEISWKGSIATGKCDPAPCKIENSTELAGTSCTCKPGFSGKISWTGPVASGQCTPAPCNVKNSNRKLGLECKCLEGYNGIIAWAGFISHGYCELEEINAFPLFWEKPFSYNGRTFKCCTHSGNIKDPVIQDITDENNLPDERGIGTKTGCGRMFGDSWHKAQNSCNVKMIEFSKKVGASIGLLRDLIKEGMTEWLTGRYYDS